MPTMTTDDGADRQAGALAARGRHWYVRRGNRVQGPYPPPQIERFLLLGRVLPTDRVSDDGERWCPLSEVPELIPDAVRSIDSEDGWNRFVEARNRVDERAGDAVSALSPGELERRRLDDERHQLRIRDLWLIALGYDAGGRPGRRRIRRSFDLLTTGVLVATLVLVCVLIVTT